MRKSISILAMIAGILLGAWVFSGKAHAADWYCEEPLTRASKSWYNFLMEPPQSDARTDAWASLLVWRFVYVLNQCDINTWNKALPSAPPLTKEGADKVRQAIKPQTFR